MLSWEVVHLRNSVVIAGILTIRDYARIIDGMLSPSGAYPEHLGPACRADSPGGLASILQGYVLRVLNLPPRLALETIRLHHSFLLLGDEYKHYSQDVSRAGGRATGFVRGLEESCFTRPSEDPWMGQALLRLKSRVLGVGQGY